MNQYITMSKFVFSKKIVLMPLKNKDVQWWCNQSPAKNINIQSDPFVEQAI